MKYLKVTRSVIIYFVLFAFLTGCAFVIQRGRRSDLEKIEELEDELVELREAKSLLEKSLSQEISDQQVKLEVQERGLVITVLTEVLFDSGKAVLRKESYSILDKVIQVLIADLRQNKVGVEGHTDNQPIKYSGWKSNWELSAQRALSVLHYLEEKGVGSGRLSVTGYSEYRPVASNAMDDGRQLNRRVEIVVLPRMTKKTGIDEGIERGEIFK